MNQSERSSNADSLWNTNPNLTTNEILNNIKAGAVRGANDANMTFMIAPFSALLVKLSTDAEKTAEKTLKATNRLYWLTWALLVVTVLLLAKEAVDLYDNHFSLYH